MDKIREFFPYLHNSLISKIFQKIVRKASILWKSMQSRWKFYFCISQMIILKNIGMIFVTYLTKWPLILLRWLKFRVKINSFWRRFWSNKGISDIPLFAKFLNFPYLDLPLYMKELSNLQANVLELVWKINFVSETVLLTIIKWMTIDVFMNTVEGWNVSKTSAEDRDEHFWQRTVAFYNKLRKSLLAHSWLNVRFWCFISFANWLALRRLRWKT